VPTPDSPVLEFQSVGKSFGPAIALNSISCAVDRGQFVTLFGPNGAGKTTLVRLAATLARPTHGTVLLFGKDVRNGSPALRRRIGVVSHRSFLYPELTARENLRFFARLFDPEGADDRVIEAARAVGLEDRLDDAVGTFSRGLEQRCSIARALVHAPDVLFLDEPYAGLDPVAAATLTRLLRQAHQAGTTVLVTSHDLGRGADLADCVGILDRGALRYWGAPPTDLAAVYEDAVQGSIT
jgi:heme exporter protein A